MSPFGSEALGVKLRQVTNECTAKVRNMFNANLRPLIFTHTGNYPYVTFQKVGYVTFVICPKHFLG